MISKRIVFLVVIFLYCLFPRSVLADRFFEIQLSSDPQCWTFADFDNTQIVFDYQKCRVSETPVEVGIYGDYCTLNKDGGDFTLPYTQLVMHKERDGDGKWHPVDNPLYQQEYNWAYYCTCTGTGDSRTCNYNKIDINFSGFCPAKTITYYTNNGKDAPKTYSGIFDQPGEEICEGDKIVRCNKSLQRWDDTGTVCEPGKCLNYKKSGSSAMSATCVGETSPNKCSDDNTKVLIHNGMDYYQVDPKIHFNSSENCNYCVKTASGIKCVGSLDQITGDCYLVNNGKTDNGDYGDKICYQNSVYICKQTNEPNYVIESNCPEKYKDKKDEEKKITCGFPKGGGTVVECVTEGTLEGQDPGLIPGTSVKITTKTSEDFWCHSDHKRIRTAIGCIPIDINELVTTLLPYIFGIAGGIAFLMMVYGFIMVSTSSGDEKKVQEAQKIITSAITGLLVSVFALFLYKLIAVDILQIPGIN